MANTFADDRGTITDLLVGDKYSITRITFNKEAVRGNHYHEKTIQHDVVLKGELICGTRSDGRDEICRLKAGDEITHPPGVMHAYRAVEDSEIVSICYGIRVGEDYSKDTFKLKEPLI